MGIPINTFPEDIMSLVLNADRAGNGNQEIDTREEATSLLINCLENDPSSSIELENILEDSELIQDYSHLYSSLFNDSFSTPTQRAQAILSTQRLGNRSRSQAINFIIEHGLSDQNPLVRQISIQTLNHHLQSICDNESESFHPVLARNQLNALINLAVSDVLEPEPRSLLISTLIDIGTENPRTVVPALGYYIMHSENTEENRNIATLILRAIPRQAVQQANLPQTLSLILMNERPISNNLLEEVAQNAAFPVEMRISTLLSQDLPLNRLPEQIAIIISQASSNSNLERISNYLLNFISSNLRFNDNREQFVYDLFLELTNILYDTHSSEEALQAVTHLFSEFDFQYSATINLLILRVANTHLDDIRQLNLLNDLESNIDQTRLQTSVRATTALLYISLIGSSNDDLLPSSITNHEFYAQVAGHRREIPFTSFEAAYRIMPAIEQASMIDSLALNDFYLPLETADFLLGEITHDDWHISSNTVNYLQSEEFHPLYPDYILPRLINRATLPVDSRIVDLNPRGASDHLLRYIVMLGREARPELNIDETLANMIENAPDVHTRSVAIRTFCLAYNERSTDLDPVIRHLNNPELQHHVLVGLHQAASEPRRVPVTSLLPAAAGLLQIIQNQDANFYDRLYATSVLSRMHPNEETLSSAYNLEGSNPEEILLYTVMHTSRLLSESTMQQDSSPIIEHLVNLTNSNDPFQREMGLAHLTYLVRSLSPLYSGSDRDRNIVIVRRILSSENLSDENRNMLTVVSHFAANPYAEEPELGNIVEGITINEFILENIYDNQLSDNPRLHRDLIDYYRSF